MSPSEMEEIYSPFEKEGRSVLFHSQYSDTEEYDGKPYEILRRATEADNIDAECLPQWVVSFGEGTEPVFAFPEECVPSIIVENSDTLTLDDIEAVPFPDFSDDGMQSVPVHVLLDYAEEREPRIRVFSKESDASAAFEKIVRGEFSKFHAELPEDDEYRDGDGNTLAECLDKKWFYDEGSLRDVRLVTVPACGSSLRPDKVTVVVDDGGCVPYVWRVFCNARDDGFRNLVDFYIPDADDAHDGSGRTKSECINERRLFVERSEYRDSCYAAYDADVE